jgi:autotransporter-associated beta strand protein
MPNAQANPWRYVWNDTGDGVVTGVWTDLANWTFNTSVELPTQNPPYTKDLYVMQGGTANSTRTVTIPGGTIIYLDGTRQAQLDGVNANSTENATAGVSLYANRTRLVINGAGLYVSGRTYNASTGGQGQTANGETSAHWIIDGDGVLDTGSQQTDGHYAIWVSRADYAFDSKDSLANLNIEAILTGGGNIIVQHSGNDNTGLLMKGDASQFTGTVLRRAGGRFVGWTGAVSVGEALFHSANNSYLKDVTTNSVFGLTVTGGTFYIQQLNDNFVALTGNGSYVGAYKTDADAVTGGYVNAAPFKLNDGTIFVRGGALGTSTANDVNGATVQFISQDVTSNAPTNIPVTGTLNLANAAARIKVGTNSFEWVRGTAAEYGLPAETPESEIYPKSFNYSDVGTPATATFAGRFIGAQSLVKIGAGRLILSGLDNSYTGGTVVNEGTLAIYSDFNTAPGTNTLSGGALEFVGAHATYFRPWVLAGTSNAVVVGENETATFSGQFSASGSTGFVKIGAGTLNLVRANNRLSAPVVVREGSFGYWEDSDLGTSVGTLNTLESTALGVKLLDSRTYARNWAVQGAGSVNIARGIEATFTGEFSGTGSLTKTGTGTLALTGRILPALTISAGTLSSAGATFDVTVNSGASFVLKSGALSGNVLVKAGAALAAGVPTGTTAAQVGDLTFESAAVLRPLGAGVPVRANTLVIGEHALVDISFVLEQITTEPLTVLEYASLPGGSPIFEISNAEHFRSRPEVRIEDGKVLLVGTVDAAPKGLEWTTTNNGVWDVATANWEVRGEAGLPDTFHFGDSVWFTSASDSRNVTLTGDLHPGVVNVEAPNGRDYTFGGTGSIIGGAAKIVKTGGGNLTINTANTYGGGTEVRGGTVIAGTPTALGTGTTSLFDGTKLTLTNAASGLGSGIAVVASAEGEVPEATLYFNTSAAGSTIAYNGAITGAGVLKLTSNAPLNTANTELGRDSYAHIRAFTDPRSLNAFVGTVEIERGKAQFTYDETSDWSGANFLLTNTDPKNDNNSGGNGDVVFTGSSGIVKIGNLAFANANIILPRGSVLDVTGGVIDRLPTATTANKISFDGSATAALPMLTSSSGLLTINAGDNIAAPLRMNIPFGELDPRVPLNVVKNGAAELVLVNGPDLPSLRPTGTFTLNGGTQMIDATWQRAFMGGIIVNNANLRLAAGSDIFGGSDNASPTATWAHPPITLNEGAVFGTAGPGHNAFYGFYLNGGTIRNTYNSDAPTLVPALIITGYVIVNGDTTSLIARGSKTQAPTERWDIGVAALNAFPPVEGDERPAGNYTLFRVLKDAVNGDPGLIVEASLTNGRYNRNEVGGIVKSGPGTMILVSSNNYGGETRLNAGTLQVGYNGEILTTPTETTLYTGTSGNLGIGGAVTAAAGTKLIIERSTQDVFQNYITSQGDTIKRGAGIVQFSAGNFTVGEFIVEQGGLRLAAGRLAPSSLQLWDGALTSAPVINLSDNGFSFAGHSAANPVAADITGNLTLSGGHTLSIGKEREVSGQTLNITGDVVLSGGRVEFAINGELGDSLKVLGDVTASNARIVLRGDVSTWVGATTDIDGDGNTVLCYDLITANNQLFLTDFTLDDSGLYNAQDAIPNVEVNPANTKVLRIAALLALDTYYWNDGPRESYEQGRWEVGAGTPDNWLHDVSGTPTPTPFFNDNVAVIFDDAHSNTRNISILAQVKPFSINVDTNSAEPYIFTNSVQTEVNMETGLRDKGSISGFAAIVKSGAGTLILQTQTDAVEEAALNSFTRGVTIKGGVVEVRGPGKLLGDNRLPIMDATGWREIGYSNPEAADSLLGAGKSGRELVLDGGTLRFNGTAGNATTSNRSFTVGGAGGGIEIASTAANTRVWFTGDLSDTATVAGNTVLLVGTGLRTLTLTGAGGAGAVTASGTTSTTAGGILSLRLADGDSGEVLAVEKTGAGVWVLDGANSYSGGTAVREGFLAVATSAAAGTGVVTLAGGAFGPAGIGAGGVLLDSAPVSVQLSNGFNFAGGEIFVPYANVLRLTGSDGFSGAGELIKTGSGVLVVAGNNITPGKFTGGTRVSAGALELAVQTPLGAVGTASLERQGFATVESGAELRLANASVGGNVTIAALEGGGRVTSSRAADSSTLIINTGSTLDGESVALPVFTGALADGESSTLKITKAGAGTQVLAGTGAFSGGVNVVQGVLRLGSAKAVGDAVVTVNENNGGEGGQGTLDVSGVNFAARDADGALLAHPVVVLASTAASITDALGGATLPEVSLLTDGRVRSGGVTTLGTVRPAEGAVSPVLVLDSISAVSPVYIVNAESYVAPGSISLLDGTLRLEASERLVDPAHVEGGEVRAKLNFQPGATLLLPFGSVTQTFASLTGAGAVEGFGTIRLIGSEQVNTAPEFTASLRDSVNFVLASGYLRFTDATAGGTSNGTILVSTGATLIVESVTDVFGNAILALESGTLRFNTPSAAPVVSFNHPVHLEGETAIFESAGGPVALSGSTSFGTAVGESYRVIIRGDRAANAVADVFATSLEDPTWVLGSSTRLVKDGTGTWVLGATGTRNTYTGGTSVNSGILRLGVSGAIPAGTAVALGSSTAYGVLDLNGFSATVSEITTARVDERNTIINSAAPGLVLPVLRWTVAVDGLKPAVQADDQTYVGAIGSSTNFALNGFDFVKAGRGALAISGRLYHTGETRVEAGVLRFNEAAAFPAASAGIVVSPGATLDVTPIASGVSITRYLRAGSAPGATGADLRGLFILAGGTLEIGDGAALDTTGTLRIDGTLRTAAGASLLYSLTRLPGGTNSVLQATTLDLSAPATLSFDMVDSFITPGNYTLVEYTGTLVGDAAAKLIVTDGSLGTDPRYSYNIATEAVEGGGGRIILGITSRSSTNPIKWVGGYIGAETRWSLTDKNFRPNPNDNPEGAQLVAFSNAAAALFDDSAAGYDITIPAGTAAVIGDIVFDNSEGDYVVNGPGSIDGEGTLTKRGDGALTLKTANTYTGRLLNGVRQIATFIEGGSVILGDDAAFGRDSVKIGSATLAKEGLDRTIANTLLVADNARAVVDTGDDGTFTLAGTLSGGRNASITKAGEGTLLLAGDVSAYTGALRVPSGTLALADGTDLGGTAITLAGQAVIELAGDPGDYTFKLGALTGSATSSVAPSSPGTKTLEIGATGENTVFAGAFDKRTDKLALVKVGAGELALTGNNTGLADGVVILGGTLRLGDGVNGTLIPGPVSIGAGAKLILDMPRSHTLAAGAEAFVSDALGTIEKRGANTLTFDRDYQSLEGKFILSAGVAALSSSGTFGKLSIENNATILLQREDSYTLTNNITGAGIIEKYGAGTTTYLGKHSGTGTTYLHGGTLQFGDSSAYNDTLKDQKHLAAIVTDRGTTIRLSPAEGTAREPGKITLADVTGSGRIIKDSPGISKLIGVIQIHDSANNAGGGADIVVQQGELSVGDGDVRNGRPTLHVGSSIKVSSSGLLAVARTGATYFDLPVASEGVVEVRGDYNGGGLAILAHPGNNITGSIAIFRSAVLQIGEAGAASRINDGTGAIAVSFDPRSVLRFNKTSSGTTGANLVLSGPTGGGIVEYNGGSLLHFNSATASGANKTFSGTFLASNGTFSIDAGAIPAAATLEATGAGNLLVLAPASTIAAPTVFSAKLGTGDGSLTLGAKTAAPAAYEFASAAVFGGAIAVGENATLHLAQALERVRGVELGARTATVTARTLRVENGGTLAGNGNVNGDVNNLIGGTVRPGNSVGQINVAGNFLNSGRLVIDVDSADGAGAGAAGVYSTIRYTGAALLDTAGSLVLRVKKSVFDALGANNSLKFLVDEAPDGAGVADLIGNFSQDNVFLQLTDDEGNAVGAPQSRQFLTYNKGDDGLTLLFASGVAGIPELNLHKSLQGWEQYITGIFNGDNHALIAAISDKLLGARDISSAFNAASPAALAALTAMPLGIARNSSDILHSHLESLRFGRRANGNRSNTQPYLLGTGIFENNGTANDAPAFDYRAYGGIVGIDQNVGERLLFGANAGYSHGDATGAWNSGKIKADNVRGSLYGTLILDKAGFWYADAAVSAGYTAFDIRHDSAAGSVKTKPDGFDVGASFTVGGAAVVPGTRISFSPYAELDYGIANVDGFTESGHDLALRVKSFNQDSLRAKFGTGINWQVPTYADFALRVGLDVSYTRELLDTEAPIRGRFTADVGGGGAGSGGGFLVNAAATALDFVQIGPVVDVDFTEDITFHAGYQFGTDLKHQQVHQVTATFRIRF